MDLLTPEKCGREDDNPRMGRRETHDSSTMTTSERTELGSLQGIAYSDDGSSLKRSVSADTRLGADKTSSLQPVRTLSVVKKHQHKHNLKHRYDVLETLGKGTYGKVKKAVERGSGKTVAIKSIRKERITDDLDRVHIQREIEIISSLKHPNIIRIHEVFESKDKIVIVMDYASQGELYDYVNERRRLPEAEARDIFRQITSAVHYCHKNGVVHRDLKLENILLDQDFNVKLADFGLSNYYQRGHLLQTYCGSPLYASPEIVKGLPYQGPEVDCWALGVLLYALVYGSMPFDGADYKALTQQISRAHYRRPQPPSDACALIDWMLTVKVEERATVEDIANHWWVNWGFEEPVCDCQCSQDCASPLLARYIDWQNRAPCEPRSASPPPDHQYCFSLPLKPAAARHRGSACLKKSRKENAISQPAHCAGAPRAPAAAADKKKPKGILKTQSSFDAAFLPHRGAAEGLSQAAGGSLTLPAGCQLSSKMPKKGILKKLYEGESGYSSSPERAADSNGGSNCSARPSREKGSTCAEVVRRRKGILKRNGKFSASLDLPDEQATILQFPESLQQLLLTTGGTVTSAHPHEELQQQAEQGAVVSSRPASVISDDSFLSCDSFDLLDMAAHPHRKLFSGGGQRSVYSSEEELEDQGMGRQRGKSRWEEEEEDSLQERQEVFRQAKEITEQL
ncbi:NUAK family SNF1-like kinase 1 isoform X2 [Anguilla rostrata]|uniref:NUAK family SNF1-like kinase 1 isoform X2 n=1 Tax=Anguilla rostrata TaxID=7938 RepID=UPI0030D0CAC1